MLKTNMVHKNGCSECTTLHSN